MVRELLDHGYEVTNVDRVAPPERLCPLLQADLTQYGEVVEVLEGAWGVVHLGAIPANNLFAPERTFRENTASTFNVFQAAMLRKLSRVVWASSETTLGLPFDRVVPAVVPVDETHYPYPESTYSLSKVVGEAIAAQFARWSGIPFVGLRFSNVMEPHDYVQRFPTWQHDPTIRRWNLWGYIDARDAEQSCRLGLEVPLAGSENFIIAAADTCMLMPNAELLAAVFPQAKLAGGTGPHETLLSIAKARGMLGFAPAYSWRDAARM